jgi:O-antigen ligase
MERPWIGYGFGAFWAGESELGNAIRAKLGWQEPIIGADNAWLDAWLSIGALGVGLAILILSALSLKILQSAATRKAMDSWTVWSLGFIMSVWAYSITESVFPSYNTLTWILFIVLAAKTECFGQRRIKKGDLILDRSVSA